MSEKQAESPNDAIRVEGLSKCYGKIKAIDGISFRVAPGHVVGFLGPNGAGKSTTMRILCGLMQASAGRAYICGIPVASRPEEVKRRIGYMPEHNPLPGDMRVIEYLCYRARLREIHGKRQKELVDEAMEVCDLHRKARRRLIGTLSKGYRQRVGIADAILAKPEVIIMDEPTIGLDPHQILAIRKLIESLKGRMTVVISSHILPEIELVCDEVIIINQGRVVASGVPNDLRKDFITNERFRLSANCDGDELRKALKRACPHAKLVKNHKGSAEGGQNYILEAGNSSLEPSVLLKKLSGQESLHLEQLARIEPTLEDIFMAATKRSWDQTISPFPANGSNGSAKSKS